MKIHVFKLTLAAILALILVSCNDDDDYIPKFNSEFLKQTEWTGTFKTIKDGDVESSFNITMFFTTDSRGTYDSNNNLIIDKDFEYGLDDNLMVIYGRQGRVIVGDWVLLEIKKNELSFRKGLSSSNTYYKLDLRRKTERRNR